MAEQVNQRIESMMNELEQMKRTNLFNDDEIKTITRKRKNFEYKIQRRSKKKEDFTQYIEYEMALLADITLRRTQRDMTEKKHEIEYSICKRLNKVFKQCIRYFQDDVETYFEYIKFCKSVGFEHAVSNILTQMIQIHGDKAKVWELAGKWEWKEQDNMENARGILLKGIQRHSDAESLYLDLFEVELTIAAKEENEEEKEVLFKRAEVVWKNGMQNIPQVSYLFKICDLAIQFGFDKITKEIKKEIWSRHETTKEIWTYIAQKELEGDHWTEAEDYIYDEDTLPEKINLYMGISEEALKKFRDEELCTTYIHSLLGLSNSICSDKQKIFAVKQAWYFGHEYGLLTSDMYDFGITMLNLADEIPREQFLEILDKAITKEPSLYLFEEKLNFHLSDEKKCLAIIHEAGALLNMDDQIRLWCFMLNKIDYDIVLKDCLEQFEKCDSAIIVAVKHKLLQKVYEHNGLRAARELFSKFLQNPPNPVSVHQTMISIELSEDLINVKNVRKYFEILLQQHGVENAEIWSEYIEFESEAKNMAAIPGIYRRAVATLKKELVDDFIKAQELKKLK